MNYLSVYMIGKDPQWLKLFESHIKNVKNPKRSNAIVTGFAPWKCNFSVRELKQNDFFFFFKMCIVSSDAYSSGHSTNRMKLDCNAMYQ